MTYHIGYTQAVKKESYHLVVDSDTHLYRYHYESGRRITRTYGATTVHYSYKKVS